MSVVGREIGATRGAPPASSCTSWMPGRPLLLQAPSGTRAVTGAGPLVGALMPRELVGTQAARVALVWVTANSEQFRAGEGCSVSTVPERYEVGACGKRTGNHKFGLAAGPENGLNY